MSGGRHENARAWTAEEDATLLRLIEIDGKRWKQISTALQPLGDRTPAMVRNRYLRIKRGRWLTEQGKSKNRCGLCGELKRGHVCKSAPGGKGGVFQETSSPGADGQDDDDALSNSDTMQNTPCRDADDDEAGDADEAEEAEGPSDANAAERLPPSVAGLVVATATVAYEPPTASLGSAFALPSPRVSSVQKQCKLERQDSLEVLAVAASIALASPALG